MSVEPSAPRRYVPTYEIKFYLFQFFFIYPTIKKFSAYRAFVDFLGVHYPNSVGTLYKTDKCIDFVKDSCRLFCSGN